MFLACDYRLNEWMNDDPWCLKISTSYEYCKKKKFYFAQVTLDSYCIIVEHVKMLTKMSFSYKKKNCFVNKLSITNILTLTPISSLCMVIIWLKYKHFFLNGS